LFDGVQVVIAKTDYCYYYYYYYYYMQLALCIASTVCKERNFKSRVSLKEIMAFKGSGRIGAN